MPVLIPSSTPSSVTWADWAQRLQIRLPQCPLKLISNELRECAIRFYRDSRAWQVNKVEIATIETDTIDYTVTLPSNTALVGLPVVWLDDEEIDEARPGELDEYDPEETGAPEKVGVVSQDGIRVAPIPSTDGAVLTATVAYCPSDDATGLREDLYFAHRDTIEAMTLARMMSQPGKPWSSPAMAGSYESEAASSALFDASMAGPSRRRGLRTRPV